VSITNREKLNLERFGCTLKESTGVFLVDWRGKRLVHAQSATIFARLACFRTRTAPIVLLALEISSVRPLPLYFYFPFDLKSKVHRKCLSRLTETGEIKLSLLAGKGTCKRTHQLAPHLRLRASELYEEALQALESIEPNKYDFNSALQLVERNVRIPSLLNRMILDDTVREISGGIDEAILAVPNENRELARNSVNVAAEAFLPYYRNNSKTFLENLRFASLGSTCALDLHREFADNPEALTKFLSDALAVTLSRQQLGALAGLVALIVAFVKLPFKEPTEHKEQPSTTELTPTIPEPPAGLVSLVQSMGASGISKDTASKFLQLIGLEIGGRPGRPTKDYSREYELKATKSWTQVAAQALLENAELREEFGGRTYESLPFEEQENLKNRIREGVRSYAERMGKPFPIERV
jgi:hypothetical protein